MNDLEGDKILTLLNWNLYSHPHNLSAFFERLRLTANYKTRSTFSPNGATYR